MLEICAGVWACWIAINAAMMLGAPLIIREPRSAYTNGFRIIVPAYWRVLLTEAELDAIVAHERGHLAKWHPWRNLIRVCCLLPRSIYLHRRQEFEADDYAATHADAKALARALRKLSSDPFDSLRAGRLESLQT